MQITKPSIPRGTRDYGPETMAKRMFIFESIKSVYKKYGFLPIETPSMENLSVLTGKYGDEGDQLIFKILNSGNFLEQVSPQDLEEGYKKLTPKISEKALRYDLTVPFARFVVMHRNDITFPFKRYQIQPVWRADRPQKGRYREFYQCDADIVGTDSLLCEAELISIINEVFALLGIKNFTIKINNRKILQGIVEILGKNGKEAILCVAIDKLDKIGLEGVNQELINNGFTEQDIEKLKPLLMHKGNYYEKITFLKEILFDSAIGNQGITEIEQVWEIANNMNSDTSNLQLDLSLARGLSYYTGAIFEVKINDVQIGSVSGGGRYDNLTGIFGMPNISGVGISFGIDRIYDVMDELNLFPNQNSNSTKILVTFFDKNGFNFSLELCKKLRDANINTEQYPDIVKIKKQFEYANKKNIPFVAVIGDEEIKENKITLKDMLTGTQERLNIEAIISKLNSI